MIFNEIKRKPLTLRCQGELILARYLHLHRFITTYISEWETVLPHQANYLLELSQKYEPAAACRKNAEGNRNAESVKMIFEIASK